MTFTSGISTDGNSQENFWKLVAFQHLNHYCDCGQEEQEQIDIGMRRGFSLLELLAVVAIVAMLLAIAIPAVFMARESSRRVNCLSNLQQLSLATLSYHAAAGRFPSGGDPQPIDDQRPGFLLELLDYLEHGSLRARFDLDKSIVAEPNATLAEVAIVTLFCPSDWESNRVDPMNAERNWRCSNYVAVQGATPQGETDAQAASLCGGYATSGVIFPASATRDSHIVDGLSNTLLYGERFYYLSAWQKGNFYFGSTTTETCTSNSKNLRWPITSCVECNANYVGDAQAAAGMEKTVRYNDLYFGSRHPGGAGFAFVDGHCDFIVEETDLQFLRSLATIQGGEDSNEE